MPSDASTAMQQALLAIRMLAQKRACMPLDIWLAVFYSVGKGKDAPQGFYFAPHISTDGVHGHSEI